MLGYLKKLMSNKADEGEAPAEAAPADENGKDYRMKERQLVHVPGDVLKVWSPPSRCF